VQSLCTPLICLDERGSNERNRAKKKVMVDEKLPLRYKGLKSKHSEMKEMGKTLTVLMAVCLMACGGNGNDGGQNPATIKGLEGNYMLQSVGLICPDISGDIEAGERLRGDMIIYGTGRVYLNLVLDNEVISAYLQIFELKDGMMLLGTFVESHWLPYTYDGDTLRLVFPEEVTGADCEMSMTWLKISDVAEGATRERPVTTDDVIGDIYRGIKGIYGKVYY